MRNEFGNWLREQIKRSGRTQAEFANLVGIEQPHLSRILNGTRGASNSVLENIATALGLPLETVLREAGILRPKSEVNDIIAEALEIFSGLSEAEQLEFLEYLRFKNERAMALRVAQAKPNPDAK